LFFPLATVPYLARVLGVHQWGLVAFAQAFGVYVGLLVEFGFNLSATRDVARHRDDRERLSHVLAGVLGAKVSLALVSIVIAFALQHFLRQFRENPYLLWAGVTAGIAQAFNMGWFYQGLERMRTSAALDVAGKAVGCFGVFLLVHSPAHAARVLAIQAFGSTLATSVLLVMAYREVRFRWPSTIGTLDALRTGGSMFLFRSAVSLYTTMNTLMVGILAGPVAVGCFAGAEKLCRAAVALQQPLSQSLYPKLSFLHDRNKERAASVAWIGTSLLLGLGAISSVILFLAAGLLVHLLLGPKYVAAVPIVRILAFLPIGVSLACAIAYQWMLPLRLDRQMTISALLGGVWCLLVGLILYPFLGPSGVAVGTVTSEFVVAAYYIVALRAYWRRSAGAPAENPVSVV
jgi:PST family polysaccharide transporter